MMVCGEVAEVAEVGSWEPHPPMPGDPLPRAGQETLSRAAAGGSGLSALPM